MIFLRAVFIFLLIVVISWTGYFYYQYHRIPTLEDGRSSLSQFSTLFSKKFGVGEVSLPKIGQGEQQSVAVAIDEGKKRVDEALNDAIVVASASDKPAAQKALDFGRYLYCKQVVEQYDQGNK